MVYQPLFLLLFLALTVYLSFVIWSKLSFSRSESVLQGSFVSEEIDIPTAGTKSKQTSRLPWSTVLVSYFSLLAGMVSIIAYRSIKNTGSIEASGFGIDCVLTILVSPLILLAMLSTARDLKRLPWYLVALTGYQNGFFWQTIFGEVFKKLS